jgi:methylamine dehydrogenase heavy chain
MGDIMIRINYFMSAFLLYLLVLPNIICADLQPEKITIEKMMPADPHRVYLTDLNLNSVIDGRIHILDGNDFRYLGLISTGLFGVTALSNDSSKMYVATTYHTKRNRGDRFDQFEIYSTENLKLESELIIPPKHAQTLPYKGTIISSKHDKYVFIQNATPASSVTVINTQTNQVVSEISTPGCWIILPTSTNEDRFSTLCGDGTVLTVTLDKKGQKIVKKRSRKIFDAEKNPVFVQAEAIGDVYYLISYLGMVYEVNVAADTAKLKDQWPLIKEDINAQGWRPGGYQLSAIDKASRKLFVGMHDSGKDGSHKTPAKEIWAYDIDTKQRIARANGNNSIAFALTKNKEPHLYVYDGVGAKFHKYETFPLFKKISESEPVGAFAGLVELH